jgi:hypothetical protein
VPPRYAYWTILVDEQPTAFRAADPNDLQPTYKRLREKHPSARMVWFQNGKIWNSRLDAREAMRVRGERGRTGDFRQRKQERREGKLEWRPKGAVPNPRAPTPSGARARARGSGERRDRTWRPGGEHRDPRQKYKDARKAKWTRVKQNIRTRWEAKQERKKKDEE